MTRWLVRFVGLMLVASAAFAQQAIPTPAEYLGYRLGEKFTTYDRILDYFGELTKRSPRITLQSFGQTYEGRPLVLAVVTSEKNRAALDDIRRNVAALAEPDNVDVTRADEIARTTPAIVYRVPFDSIHRPIGSAPARCRRTNSSLTIACGAVSGSVSATKSLPDRSGIPIVSK